MASSTSSITTPTFTGTSTFSTSFQQVLTNAVSLASLPMQQMQNHVNDLTKQQNAIAQLEATFQSLDISLQSIGSATGGNPSATVSDSSVLSASTTSSALAGTYSIQVDSLGSYTTTLSQAGSTTVTDPTTQGISPASSFTLTINGTQTAITPSGTSLESLADAINSSGAAVQATIVNIGSNTSPDYRLAVMSNNLAGDSIQLADTSGSLLSTLATGSAATYQVNGSSTVLSTNSRQVTLSPGLSVTMLGTSSQPETVTVSQNYSSLETALSNFVSAYNSAVTAVGQQVGQNGGALSGQSIVYTLANMLQGLSQYSGSGSVTSLSDLGISVDSTGQMSFDQSVFTSLSSSAVSQFLGSASSGGFMQAATNAMNSVDDTGTGDLETEYAALQNQIDGQNQLIQKQQTRITDMQTNLESQLTQADAAIATLQSQKAYYTELFQAEYGSTSGTNG